MIQTVNKDMFFDWFRSSDTYRNNFSYQGLDALFNHLEEYENDTGEEIDFDPIAICCEWSEYENLQEIIDNYSCIKNLDDLYDYTTVIKVYNFDETENGRLIIRDF